MKKNRTYSKPSRRSKRRLFVVCLLIVLVILAFDFLTFLSFDSFPRDIEHLIETESIYTVFDEWYSYIGYFFASCFYLIMLGCMCAIFLLNAWDGHFNLLSFLMIWHSSLGIVSVLGRIGQMLSASNPNMFSDVADGLGEISFLPVLFCVMYFMNRFRFVFIPFVLADCFSSVMLLLALVYGKNDAVIYVWQTLSDGAYFLCIAVSVLLALLEIKNKNEDMKYYPPLLIFSSFLVFVFFGLVIFIKNGFSVTQVDAFLHQLQISTTLIRNSLMDGILFIAVSLLIIFNLLRRYHQNILQLQSLQLRDEANMEYAKSLQKYETQVREIKHDIANILHVAATLCENGEYERLSDYLATVTGQIASVSTGRYCSHILVNYLLLMFEERFKKISCEFRCKAFMPSDLEIEDYDLARELNNILQNAWDAVAKLPENDRWVEFVIRMDGEVVRIDCRNPYKGKLVVSEDGILQTSKADRKKHGHGMSIIYEIAEKYGGVAVPLINEGVFEIKVAIPNGKLE